MAVRILMLLSVLSCCLTSATAAVTVGTCESNKHSYPTITAAIKAVEDGGEIHICPGSYAEVLTIQKSLTLHGIGDVTLTFPVAGLAPVQINETSADLYTQVYISDAHGPVLIDNVAIQSGNLFLSRYLQGAAAGPPLCQDGILGADNYWGVVSLNSFVTLDHVSVLDHGFSGGGAGVPITNMFPCGGGVRFQGGKGIVTHGIVSGFATGGILGATEVDHSLITGSVGSYSVGISGAPKVTNNTITGPGPVSYKTRGIVGAEEIEGNVVQGWSQGIDAGNVKHNTFINNGVAVTGTTEISDILVVADPTYQNPLCPANNCGSLPGQTPYLLPTIAIDLACADGTRVRNNSIVGVGIGFANVDGNRQISSTNLLYNVSKTSTKCQQ